MKVKKSQTNTLIFKNDDWVRLGKGEGEMGPKLYLGNLTWNNIAEGLWATAYQDWLIYFKETDEGIKVSLGGLK